ncbi:MAG TPA: serine/threonine-protein kinase [Kofleriaceae bacterium]
MHAIAHPDVDTVSDLFDGASLYCPTCGDSFSTLCDRCPDDGSLLVQRQPHGDSLIGRLLDRRFRVLRLLAQGSMGNVYEGMQLPIKRPVAIKVIRDELGYDPSSTQRFHREARLLTRIAHPNIVDVIDYGETADGCLYIVMDLLRGKTLDVVIAETGAFSVRRTCEIGLQLCNALVAAHAHGVVHRDFKPANIYVLVELGDWVKVIDFGLAKQAHDPASEVTFAGAVLGTPLYMAPETISYNIADPRSDLYALGCILHELLAGTPPFYGESSALVLARHLDDPPPPLRDDVPPTLRRLISALLAKNPDHRPANALTVSAVLEHCLAAEMVAELPTLIHAALPKID